jgi:two-component system chemotaxis sensor kinase CheA
VHNRVRSLGGSVDMRTAPGKGTTVTLRLPLTLAIVRSLLARIGDETYAIPMTHVSETVELHPQILHTLKGREVLMIREEVLPLIRLRQLLHSRARRRVAWNRSSSSRWRSGARRWWWMR